MPLADPAYPKRGPVPPRPSSPDDVDPRPAYNSANIKVWLEFLGKRHPSVPLEKILADAGMTRYQTEDTGHWFDQDQIDRFYQEVHQATGDPDIALKAGRYFALSKTIGPFRQVTMGLLNLRTVYLLMAQLSPKITRASRVQARSLGPRSVEIVNTPLSGFQEKPYQCENRLGIYESIGQLFTDRYARVTHPECIHRGDPCCRYVVTWEPVSWARWLWLRNLMLLVGGPLTVTGAVLSDAGTGIALALGWIAASALATCLIGHFRVRDYRHSQSIQGDAAQEYIDAIKIRYDNASLIQEIGQTVATLCTEDELVSAVARCMYHRSSYDRCMIMLADHTSERLEFRAGYGYDESVSELLRNTAFNLDNPESRGIFVRAYREQRPLLVQDIRRVLDAMSPRSQEFVRRLGGKALICVPLAYENQVLGILAVDNTLTEQPLAQSDVNLLMGIASHLAVGIINTRAFDQLKESEKKYRDLVESASSAIVRMGLDGRITFINTFAQELFGHSRERLVGRPFVQSVRPDAESGQAPFTDLETKLHQAPERPLVFEVAHSARDGRQIWMNWTFRTIQSSDGRYAEVLCIGSDITQLKHTRQEKAELEAQLLRAQKMEAIGTLAGGVAHDLNNVLAGLINYPELMLMRMPADSPLRRYVLAIQKSGENAAAIVQDLLTLARRNVAEMEVANLSRIANDFLMSPGFERLKRDHPWARVTARINPAIENILGSSVHLSKTVMNLLTNAVEALEGRPGEVVVVTENRHLSKAWTGYEPIPAGDYVVLSVTDTGCGMAEDELRRIFEPFFTKKKMGRSGSGLGMAVVWGAIKDHGGLIDIRSAPGQGTRFDIYFSPTRQAASAPLAVSAAAYRGTGEKILVVDDVPTQLEIANEILTDLGYDVMTLDSGEAAVDFIEGNPVDMLVLDMIMDPGIDGLETYRQVIRRRPGQKAIIASGYSQNEKVREAIQLGVGTYVKKPYSMETLGLAVRSELDRAAAPALP